jgi:hypothetical protein
VNAVRRILDSAGSGWTRFWHTPLRAERLGLMRILVGVALLTDLLFEYLPFIDEFFGPHGANPAGLNDWHHLKMWLWTTAFFHTDNLTVLYTAFALWTAVTIAFTLGWHTRLMSVAVWFLTMCFLNRNYNILNSGDNILQIALFLLMFAPCGQALSLDAGRRRRARTLPEPNLTPAWQVRLFQIQLAVIYCTTGLIKLKGDGPFQGTWWDGTSVHYVLNGMYMTRISYVQLPLPFWITKPMTYACVWWETLFPLLVLSRWTRRWALWFGVLFHIGIWLTIEIGWFSFYSLTLYAVWVPDEFWERWWRRAGTATPGAVEGAAA